MAYSYFKSEYFSEKDIDEFRQCFKLYAPEGFVTSHEKLGFIMRSLNIKPTLVELKNYFEKYQKDGSHLDFAEFLNILHVHLQTEHASVEILTAFKMFDQKKTGYITVKDLRFMLTQTGEKLSNKDGNFVSPCLLTFVRECSEIVCLVFSWDDSKGGEFNGWESQLWKARSDPVASNRLGASQQWFCSFVFVFIQSISEFFYTLWSQKKGRNLVAFIFEDFYF